MPEVEVGGLYLFISFRWIQSQDKKKRCNVFTAVSSNVSNECIVVVTL